MKKLLVGLTVVALMASCTNNEIIDSGMGKNSPSQIMFQPTSGAVVGRGLPADITTLQGLSDGFKVHGIANVGSSSGAMASDLFSNVTNTNYKYDGSAWNWVTPDDRKEWPQATSGKYPIQFFAAYGAPNTLAWNTVTPEIVPEDLVKNQKDILSAATIVLPAPPSTSTTTLQFKHILSAIKFKIQSTEGYKVDVKDVQIIHVTQKNTFNFLTQDWETLALDQTKAYTYFHSSADGTAQNLTFPKNNLTQPIKTNETSAAEDGQLMLVPQTGSPMNLVKYSEAAAAWVKDQNQPGWPTPEVTAALKTGAYIQLSYKMRDENGKDIVGWTKGATMTDNSTAAQNYYVTVIYPLDLNSKPWVMGKRYTYTIYLGTPDSSNGTVLNPDFEGDNDDPTNVPTDNPKVDPGNPVTQGKITFIVEVDNWSDTDNGVDIK